MKAYACTHNGKIIFRTVTDSVRGAKVNGLVVLFNVVPRDTWSDEQISDAWDGCLTKLRTMKRTDDVKVIEISVIEVGPA